MNSDNNSSEAAVCLKGYGIGMAVWVIFSAVLIFVAALIAFSADDPDSRTGTLGLAALYISALAAGCTSAVVSKKLLSVVFTALSISAAVLLCASFRPDGMQSHSAAVTALLYCLCAIIPTVGGLISLRISAKKESRPARRTRKRRR